MNIMYKDGIPIGGVPQFNGGELVLGNSLTSDVPSKSWTNVGSIVLSPGHIYIVNCNIEFSTDFTEMVTLIYYTNIKVAVTRGTGAGGGGLNLTSIIDTRNNNSDLTIYSRVYQANASTRSIDLFNFKAVSII